MKRYQIDSNKKSFHLNVLANFDEKKLPIFSSSMVENSGIKSGIGYEENCIASDSMNWRHINECVMHVNGLKSVPKFEKRANLFQFESSD